MHLHALPLLLVAAASTHAHMQLLYPPPFNASNNPHLTGAPDHELVYPQGCCARNNTAICRGYLSLLGTPAGAPVATWTAGTNITWNITGDTSVTGFVGGGTHYGGSCQVGFSVDGGETFRVAASYEGNCPHRDAPSDGSSGQDFELRVPEELPSGDAVFAWSWINREQEFFMDCAAITIVGKDGETGSPSSSAATQSTTLAPASSVSSISASSAVSSAAPSSSSTSDKIFSLEQCSCNCTTATTTTDYGDAYDADDCTCRCWKAPTSLSTTKRDLDDSHLARHIHHRRTATSTNRNKNKADDVDPNMATTHKSKREADVSAWQSRPKMLIPDPIFHDPKLPKTTAEVKYPDPGPVVVQGDGAYPLEMPSS